jgi:TRAP-type C4-dicarboxylate transport system substrate-binding protein
MRTLTTTVAAAAVAALAATPVSAIELIYGTGSGAKSRINIDGIEPYIAETTKLSNGSITWKYLPGDQIVTVRSALKGIRDGLVDAGMVIPVFVRKDLIQNNVVYDTLFIGGDDPVAAGGAAHETIMLRCPSCVEEYKKYNSFYLSSFAGSPQVLVCTKPVKTVDDVKGLKIRAPGAAQRLATELGGVPVSIPPQELALALERGGIDCAIMALNWMVSFGIQDVAKHVLDFPMGVSRGLGLIVMNRDRWNAMSEDQRKVLWDRAPIASSRALIESYIQLDNDYREKIAPTKGVTIVKGGADFQAAMDRLLANEDEAIVKGITAQGAKNAGQILANFKEALAKWRKLSQNEIKEDVDAYAAALKREIYDKLDMNKM